MAPEQHLKIKLTLGYILLIAIFSLSIIYILNEVDSLNVSKDDILTENTKVIDLSNIVSDLYATENTGRLALLSYNSKDVKNYRLQTDSLIKSIQSFKQNSINDDILRYKLDTIVELIHLKTLTFNQVLDVQSKYTQFNIFDNARSEIQEIQSSIKDNTIEIDTIADKLNMIEKIFTARTKQQERRLKLENERVVAEQKKYLDSLNKVTEKVLTKAKNTESKLLRQYYIKEEQLIKRNQLLTVELREILLEVEKIILQNSSLKYENSKSIIDDVSSNIAKVGIVIAIVAMIFGFIILIDLNKSVRNKQKLEKLNRDMERLVKDKSFFMATISHDMVSPINSLLGFSSLLENSLKTTKQQEYLKNIIQSTKYIKKMVDDLSLFSNLEYNKIKIKSSKFNFKDLLQNIEVNLKNSAQRKNIVLNFKIDNYLDTDFYSDSYRIQQILTNVISNAIKFTHKGHVTIDASFVNNHAKIKVTDTGIGINSKDHDALFKEFVQVHDTNEGNYGGSGLGLNITKRLITLLNGSIWYESELNKGTVFFINIPLKIYSEANHVQKTEDYEYDNAKKLQNKKILVIDDDLLQLKLIEEIFGNKVKKLTTLDNGKFVKEILQQEQYQLIITDMQMPLYSGLKVIEDIRSLENYRHTPVIALTGKIDFDEQEYKSLGFDLYMQKPLNINNLYNTIYKLLRIKHKVQQTSTIQPLPIQLKHDTFDLTDIFNLLDNDKEAIEPILTTFFNSYKIDIEHLKTAYENSDKEILKHTAHKMLPMFRQLHINEIVDKLAKIEREIDSLSTEQLLIEIQFIDERTPIIFQAIKKFFD